METGYEPPRYDPMCIRSAESVCVLCHLVYEWAWPQANGIYVTCIDCAIEQGVL